MAGSGVTGFVGIGDGRRLLLDGCETGGLASESGVAVRERAARDSSRPPSPIHCLWSR